MRHLNRTPSTETDDTLQLDKVAYSVWIFGAIFANFKITQAPEPLLPNFGLGSMRGHYQDITMLLTFNARERTVDDVTGLACVSAHLPAETF
jgi:hypothetical protein